MKKPSLTFVLPAIFCLFSNFVVAQCIIGVLPNGQPCGGTIITAVPYLNIAADARSTSMGNTTIALSPDANGLFSNASKLALSESKFGASVTYLPWPKHFIPNAYMASQAYYGQLGRDKKHVVGFSSRYFSYGNGQWTDFNGQPLVDLKPYDMDVALSYAYPLSPHFALGFTAKYIQSSIGRTSLHPDIIDGKAFAADISMTYHKPFRIKQLESNFTLGLSISNMGNQITYLITPNYLPTNLGIGSALNVHINKNHSITMALDFNKLLVSTQKPFTSDKPVLRNILDSFSDSPDGFKGELKEITTSFGLEYWFKEYVSIRTGLFYENPSKSNRQFNMIGIGGRYKRVNLNFSYLVPTNDQKNLLDNMKTISLIINPSDFKKVYVSKG